MAVNDGLLDARPGYILLSNIEGLYLQSILAALGLEADRSPANSRLKKLGPVHERFLDAEAVEPAEPELGNDDDEVSLRDRALRMHPHEVVQSDHFVVPLLFVLTAGDNAAEVQLLLARRPRRIDFESAHQLLILECVDRERLVADGSDEVVRVRLGRLLWRHPLVEEFEAGNVRSIGHKCVAQALDLPTAGFVVDDVDSIFEADQDVA